VKISSWRVWVTTGVVAAAVSVLMIMLTPNAGPAASAKESSARAVPCPPPPSAPATMTSTDDFLKLDGIAGGSTDAKHPGEIVISSFVWGINMDLTACGEARSKPHVSDIVFTKSVDKASPKLAQYTATGKHIPTAVVTVRKAGSAQTEFLVITLTDVVVTSYSVGAPNVSLPQDTFGVAFGRIEYKFYPQREDGGLDSPVTFCFDIADNKAC
jgi:type VI secretion system secreted protein Hcp